MAAKPSTIPRWARTAAGADAANIATPTSGESDIGYTNGQNPVSSSKTNWLFNWLTKWMLYLSDADFVGGSPGANAFGIRGTGTIGGDGVIGIGFSVTGATATNGGNFTGGADAAGALGQGGHGVVASGGNSASASSTGGTGGRFTGGNSSSGQVPGLGVTGVGGSGGTAYGVGGSFAGNGATLIGSTGNTKGAGVIGVGASDATNGGPGVAAFADHPGGTIVRGALYLNPQATPTTPVVGDIWMDSTFAGGIPRARVATGTTQALSKYVYFSGLPGATASTTYMLTAAPNSVATLTVSTLGVTQYYLPCTVMVSMGIKTSTTTVGGTITVQFFLNGSQVGNTISLVAGTVAGVYTATFNQNVNANSLLEMRVVNGVGVTTGVGQVMGWLEVV